jgi:ubiquinone/menaquinone biosynthesis C-methylase UbiE
MSLQDIQRNWHKLGKIAPLETILHPPEGYGNKWDIDEFFASGQKEIENLMAYIDTLPINVSRQTALDFGCGVGRTTQPLAQYFDVCYGLDIAPSILELANQYNKQGDKCRFILNESDNLRVFADKSLDFIYSVSTFQIIPPPFTKNYIKEFFRILAPGGLLIFQISCEPKTFKMKLKNRIPRFLLDTYYRLRHRDRPRVEMYGIKQEEISKVLAEKGHILDIQTDSHTFNMWSSYRYAVVKTGT